MFIVKSFWGNFHRHLAIFIDIWRLFTSLTEFRTLPLARVLLVVVKSLLDGNLLAGMRILEYWWPQNRVVDSVYYSIIADPSVPSICNSLRTFKSMQGRKWWPHLNTIADISVWTDFLLSNFAALPNQLRNYKWLPLLTYLSVQSRNLPFVKCYNHGDFWGRSDLQQCTISLSFDKLTFKWVLSMSLITFGL